MRDRVSSVDDRELTKAQRRWRQNKAMLSFLGGFLLMLEALEVVVDLPDMPNFWRSVIFTGAAIGGIAGVILVVRGINRWWRFTSGRD